MILVPEQQDQACLKFLETIIKIRSRNSCSCHMFSKIDQILEKGAPQIISGQDALSWGCTIMKQAIVLLGRFAVMERVSTSNVERLISFTHLLTQYMFRGVIKRGLSKKLL